MDIYIAGALALLLVWFGLVTTTDAPGWVHLLLTGGMFLLIWRIVCRGTPSAPQTGSPVSKPMITPDASDGKNRK